MTTYTHNICILNLFLDRSSILISKHTTILFAQEEHTNFHPIPSSSTFRGLLCFRSKSKRHTAIFTMEPLRAVGGQHLRAVPYVTCPRLSSPSPPFLRHQFRYAHKVTNKTNTTQTPPRFLRGRRDHHGPRRRRPLQGRRHEEERASPEGLQRRQLLRQRRPKRRRRLKRTLYLGRREGGESGRITQHDNTTWLRLLARRRLYTKMISSYMRIWFFLYFTEHHDIILSG